MVVAPPPPYHKEHLNDPSSSFYNCFNISSGGRYGSNRSSFWRNSNFIYCVPSVHDYLSNRCSHWGVLLKKVGDPDYESTEHQAGDSEDKAYYIEILGIDFNYTLTELQMACRREKAKHEKGSAKWKEIDEACRYLKEYLSNS